MELETGREKIKQIETKIATNRIKLVANDPVKSERALRVYMNLSLIYLKQFKIIKDKLHKSISKLRSVSLSIGNACAFFKMCLITKLYFRCRIITLSSKQEGMLMKIIESVLLKKLGLSEKVLRETLHANKSQLGAGIMENKRKRDRISRIITTIERIVNYRCGYNEEIMTTPKKKKQKT